MTGEQVLSPAILTENETLRMQLLQAQRLSSVGALASSVAHEFNNVLTTIINYAKLGMRGNCEPGQKQAFWRVSLDSENPCSSLRYFGKTIIVNGL